MKAERQTNTNSKRKYYEPGAKDAKEMKQKVKKKKQENKR